MDTDEMKLEVELRAALETETGADRQATIIMLSEIAACQIDRLNAAIGEPPERAEAETRLLHAKWERLKREMGL